MKRLGIAIAVLAVTAAVPSFGQSDQMAPGSQDGAGMHRMMQPEMRSQMMRNPQHLLMLAYHKNVMNFARVLDKAARQGDTVPPDLARRAVGEMRRSVDEIEKLRAGQNLPAEMQKMMDQHLVAVKTHLRDLEELSKSGRIPSQEVLKHTQVLLGGCDGAQCDLGPGKGMRGKGMPGRWMNKGGGCGGCDCMAMMPQHRQMMEQMQQKVKAQDQELAALVEKMKAAPRDKKVGLLAEIVSRMVQQRTEIVNQMEKMQHEHMMQHRHMMQNEGAAMPPPPCMTQGAEPGYDEDAESADDDSGMDMEEMNMQDED